MTIEFYDAVNGDGLFNVLGRVFAAQGAINTSRGTTVPTAVDSVLTQFQNVNPDTARNALVAAIPSALAGHQSAAGGLVTALQSFASAFLIDFVNRDTTLPQKTLTNALTELIDQMVTEGESVDRSTVSATPTAGTNTGTGKIICGTIRGDGEVIQSIIAETISVSFASSGANAAAIFTGTPLTTNLSQDWPDGSGCSIGIVSVTADVAPLLTNGGFDTFTSNVPDGWIAHVATPGTTLYGTTVEVQTVAITGSPSAGYYLLHWTAPDSNTYTTAAIAYDATADTVQAALQAIPGLESVEVSSTGTTPNFTHSVTFTGAGGNVNQLTSTNATTGGSIAHATTTAGTAFVLRGSRALVIDSDGSQQTAIYQKLEGLSAGTVYCCSLWAAVDVVPAAGVVDVELVDDIGGTVLSSCQFNASSLTTSFKHVSQVTATAADCMLRTPEVLPAAVYLRIRTSTAVSSGTSLYLDECVVTPAVQLYTGGPMVAVITGKTNWQIGDTFTIAAANNRAGLLQEWFERNFNMSALGLLLPSNGSGTETIPNSVVA